MQIISLKQNPPGNPEGFWKYLAGISGGNLLFYFRSIILRVWIKFPA